MTMQTTSTGAWPKAHRPPGRVLVRAHPVAAYFALTFALSWTFWLAMLGRGARVDAGAWPTHVPGLLAPMLAALAVTAAVDGRAGLAELGARMVKWRIGLRWLLVAVASPLALLAVAAAFQAAHGQGWPSWRNLGQMGGFPSTSPLAMWALLVLANGLGEETGWRGFALPRLERRHSPLAATTLLWLAWATWHLPTLWLLESYRGLGAAGVAGFFVSLYFGAILLTWLYHRSGNSVLALALWHGSFNLATATMAARGTVAAWVSMAVLTWGAVLFVLELAARRHGRTVIGAQPAPKEESWQTRSATGS